MRNLLLLIAVSLALVGGMAFTLDRLKRRPQVRVQNGNPAAQARAGPPKPKGRRLRARSVVLISFDGLRSDAISTLGPGRAPAFHRVIRAGATTLNARTDVDYTVTIPNHFCMITGRPVDGEDGHNFPYNSNFGTVHLVKSGQSGKEQYVASVFDVAHDRGLRTALMSSKQKFGVIAASYEEGRPDTIGGFRPDVVGTKGKKRTIVEIETPESVDSARDKKQQAAFRQVAKRSENTTFRRKVTD